MLVILKTLPLLLSLLLLNGCGGDETTVGTNAKGEFTATPVAAEIDPAEVDTATFASGCFWCVEAIYERIEGVRAAVSGYAGGTAETANYKQVSWGKTKHAETVQVYYNPEEVTYQTLVEVFFATHDPTTLNRQGPDVGPQYRSAIFYHSPRQRQIIEQHLQQLRGEGRYQQPIVTELNEYTSFYVAEEYHQDYEEKNPNDPYIRQVSIPRIRKFERQFPELLEEEYQ